MSERERHIVVDGISRGYIFGRRVPSVYSRTYI